MKTTLLATLACAVLAASGNCGPLYIQTGTDSPFEEMLRGGNLPKGQNSKQGVTGSKIDVTNKLVELTAESRRPIPKSISIHTLGNSVIGRRDFGKWSRWYQEDGSTQIFRLFKDETNMRNAREMAARVEAFTNLKWTHGPWHEWSGTYTIIKPHGCSIFQVKNNINDWAVMLNMSDNGDVRLNHRRGGEDVTIARNMTGKPFHIRVRDNGHDYEVYLDGKKVGAGHFARPKGTTGFRWGMYLGKNPMKHDAMIFVSGSTIDGN